MAELNVNDITTNTIDPTDKVYGFNADESKAPTVRTLLGTAPGIMAVGTCATAAATAAKAVTSDNWTAKPGQSILIEFTNANTANNVTLSINQANAIPVYALNTSIRLGSGTIPAGPMIFTLSADGTKFYAHTVVVDTAVTSGSNKPVTSGSVYDELLKKLTYDTKIHYSGLITDCNDATDGILCLKDVANAPTNSSGFIMLMTLSYDSNPFYKIQICVKISSTDIFTRAKSNGTWTSWVSH